MKWIKIDRDENGFATEECLDKMFFTPASGTTPQ